MKTYRRILVSQTKEQADQFDTLMEKYGQRDRSPLVSLLVANDINKKTAGRPPKALTEEEENVMWILNRPDFSDDLPKETYYNGSYMGKKELAWEAERARRVPKNLTGN